MIQLILIGLIILFVIVIFFSYRKTTEGFYGFMSDLEQDANNAISDVGSGMSSLSSDISSGVSSLSSDISSGVSSLSSDVSSGMSSLSSDVSSGVSTTPQQQPQQQSEITISGPGFNALTLQKKTELLKNIQKLIKNELISGRQTTNINEKQEKQEQELKQFEKQLMDKLETDALQQGKEYNSECKKQCEGPCPRNKDGTCPPVPDMSEYIRKDQIPCWNCTLDY